MRLWQESVLESYEITRFQRTPNFNQNISPALESYDLQDSKGVIYYTESSFWFWNLIELQGFKGAYVLFVYGVPF